MSLKVMDENKVQQKTENISNTGVIEFVGDIKSEFNKVSWTSKEELKVYTKIVVGATFVFGLAVYVMDILIQLALHTLNVSLRFIAG